MKKYSNKLIIIENSFIFSRTTKKIDDLELLEEYLKIKNQEAREHDMELEGNIIWIVEKTVL